MIKIETITNSELLSVIEKIKNIDINISDIYSYGPFYNLICDTLKVRLELKSGISFITIDDDLLKYIDHQSAQEVYNALSKRHKEQLSR